MEHQRVLENLQTLLESKAEKQQVLDFLNDCHVVDAEWFKSEAALEALDSLVLSLHFDAFMLMCELGCVPPDHSGANLRLSLETVFDFLVDENDEENGLSQRIVKAGSSIQSERINSLDLPSEYQVEPQSLPSVKDLKKLVDFCYDPNLCPLENHTWVNTFEGQAIVALNLDALSDKIIDEIAKAIVSEYKEVIQISQLPKEEFRGVLETIAPRISEENKKSLMAQYLKQISNHALDLGMDDKAYLLVDVFLNKDYGSMSFRESFEKTLCLPVYEWYFMHSNYYNNYKENRGDVIGCLMHADYLKPSSPSNVHEMFEIKVKRCLQQFLSNSVHYENDENPYRQRMQWLLEDFKKVIQTVIHTPELSAEEKNEWFVQLKTIDTQSMIDQSSVRPYSQESLNLLSAQVSQWNELVLDKKIKQAPNLSLEPSKHNTKWDRF